MGSMGSLWSTIGLYGALWVSTGPYGAVWGSMERNRRCNSVWIIGKRLLLGASIKWESSVKVYPVLEEARISKISNTREVDRCSVGLILIVLLKNKLFMDTIDRNPFIDRAIGDFP